jgi:hypothetical protein
VLINKSSGAAAGRIAAAIASAALPAYRPTTGSAGTGTTFRPGEDLTGVWRGYVIALSDTLPFSLILQADGTARVKLGAYGETVLSGASLARTGWFSGRFSAPLRPPDATPAEASERVIVNVSLRQRDNRLTGWVSALTRGQPVYGAVSYPAVLTRVVNGRD